MPALGAKKSVAAADDPRRQEASVAFYQAPPDPEKDPVDVGALLSLLFGVMGLIMKIRLCAWLSLFGTAMSLCTMRTQNVDFKQLFASISFSVMTLSMSYFGRAGGAGGGLLRLFGGGGGGGGGGGAGF